MTRKPWSHVRILIYRTWAILRQKEKKMGADKFKRLPVDEIRKSEETSHKYFVTTRRLIILSCMSTGLLSSESPTAVIH